MLEAGAIGVMTTHDLSLAAEEPLEPMGVLPPLGLAPVPGLFLAAASEHHAGVGGEMELARRLVDVADDEAALVDAGDEVVFEQPGYDPLSAAAEMLGARVVRFERRFGDGWRLDPERIERALTPRTRVLVISSPHNPSGVVASARELSEIGRLAERRGFAVVVDEVYRDLAAAAHPPSATLSPAFVSTSSLTKAYGLASLRCGWALATAEVDRRSLASASRTCCG